MSDYLPYGAGDDLPVIQRVIREGASESDPAVDLSSASGVTFTVQDINGTAVTLAGTASIPSPATDGIVQYAPVQADFATPGDYFARFRVTVGGKRFYAPNNGWLHIAVT